jgi:hypothetical protein
VVEARRHAFEAPGGIERQVDRVEFDVRDGVQQRGQAFGLGGERRGTSPGG